jgi:hypothetical protein
LQESEETTSSGQGKRKGKGEERKKRETGGDRWGERRKGEREGMVYDIWDL